MQQGSLLGSLLPLVILFGIFYFLVIRPQQKQQKAHAAMISALVKGDKIITSGGIICEVVKPEENFITVKLNDKDDISFRLDRQFVARKLDA